MDTPTNRPISPLFYIERAFRLAAARCHTIDECSIGNLSDSQGWHALQTIQGMYLARVGVISPLKALCLVTALWTNFVATRLRALFHGRVRIEWIAKMPLRSYEGAVLVATPQFWDDIRHLSVLGMLAAHIVSSTKSRMMPAHRTH